MYFGFCDLTPRGDNKVESVNIINKDVYSTCSSPPPPPPPMPKSNKTRPEIYKTSKTFMCKVVRPGLSEKNLF